MIQPPSSLPPTKKGSFVGTVTNQGFPFQPDVLYKSKSVVGTIKATPYTMPYLLAQKRESFLIFFGRSK